VLSESAAPASTGGPGEWPDRVNVFAPLDWLRDRAAPVVRSRATWLWREARTLVSARPRLRPVKPTEIIGGLITLLVIGCLVLAFLSQDLLQRRAPLSVSPTPVSATGNPITGNLPIGGSSTDSPSADDTGQPTGGPVSPTPSVGGDPITAPITDPTSTPTTDPTGAPTITPKVSSSPSRVKTPKPARTSAPVKPAPPAHRTSTKPPISIPPAATMTVTQTVSASASTLAPPPAETTRSKVTVACSKPSYQSLRVTFMNTLNRPLDLAWSGYDCVLKTFTTVQPGASATVMAYVGNVWAFLEHGTDLVVGSRSIDGRQTFLTMP